MRIFLKALSLLYTYESPTSWKISEKTNEPILTDGHEFIGLSVLRTGVQKTTTMKYKEQKKESPGRFEHKSCGVLVQHLATWAISFVYCA